MGVPAVLVLAALELSDIMESFSSSEDCRVSSGGGDNDPPSPLTMVVVEIFENGKCNGLLLVGVNV